MSGGQDDATHADRLQAAIVELEHKNRTLEDLLRTLLAEKGEMLLARLAAEKAASVVLAETAQQDLGTGLIKLGAFRARLMFEVERAHRTGDELGFLLADLDDFDAFNAERGYTEGDEALRLIAQSLPSLWLSKPLVRSPVLGREEGDRFGILLPGASPMELEVVGEGVCALVERLPLRSSGPTSSSGLTVSAGAVSADPSSSFSPKNLVTMAEDALRQAKAEGGNQVVLRHLGPYPRELRT